MLILLPTELSISNWFIGLLKGNKFRFRFCKGLGSTWINQVFSKQIIIRTQTRIDLRINTVSKFISSSFFGKTRKIDNGRATFCSVLRREQKRQNWIELEQNTWRRQVQPVKCKLGTWSLIKRKGKELRRETGIVGEPNWKKGGVKTSNDLLRDTVNIDDTEDHNRFLGHNANNIVSNLL
jgi:hypothetical protein